MSVATVYDLVARMRSRDEILDSRMSFERRLFIVTDGRAAFEVISVDRSDDHTTGYALSERTGLIVYFEQSGKAERQGMVRCRITAARDIGDRRGTLSFDGRSFGGVMPARLGR